MAANIIRRSAQINWTITPTTLTTAKNIPVHEKKCIIPGAFAKASKVLQ
jgi:hypothetical protein